MRRAQQCCIRYAVCRRGNVTRAGILIRTPVEAIRTTGRATQGVIVMRFKEEGDSVISMALTEHEESEE